jgi:hypothetical protein
MYLRWSGVLQRYKTYVPVRQSYSTHHISPLVSVKFTAETKIGASGRASYLCSTIPGTVATPGSLTLLGSLSPRHLLHLLQDCSLRFPLNTFRGNSPLQTYPLRPMVPYWLSNQRRWLSHWLNSGSAMQSLLRNQIFSARSVFWALNTF